MPNIETVNFKAVDYKLDGGELDEIIDLLPYLTSRHLDRNEVRGRLLRIVENPKQFLDVAELSGRIVGTATLTLKEIPTGFSGYIDDFVSHPEARGRGVGKGLLTLMEEQASMSGATKLELTSSSHRTSAIRLYENFGFERRDTNSFVKGIHARND